MLDRSRFDALVTKLTRDGDSWLVQSMTDGELSTVRAKAVIDATGPGCRLTRNVDCLKGIESGDTDLEPAIFAVTEGIKHSREHIELFFGSEFPNGYGWIFPRDGVEVNVGFVLGKDHDTPIPLRQKLLEFINRRYPGAKVKAVYGGMIACGQSKRPLAMHGVFKAGDAASCVNPISRSGIVESLRFGIVESILCGKIVAQSVVEWLACGTDAERSRVEASVLDRWMKAQGRAHLQIANAKPTFGKISDAQFDRAAKKLSRIPRGKASLWRIFFTVLSACPSLIWKMRSFLR